MFDKILDKCSAIIKTSVSDHSFNCFTDPLFKTFITITQYNKSHTFQTSISRPNHLYKQLKRVSSTIKVAIKIV
jgi:hypothetical protein